MPILEPACNTDPLNRSRFRHETRRCSRPRSGRSGAQAPAQAGATIVPTAHDPLQPASRQGLPPRCVCTRPTLDASRPPPWFAVVGDALQGAWSGRPFEAVQLDASTIALWPAKPRTEPRPAFVPLPAWLSAPRELALVDGLPPRVQLRGSPARRRRTFVRCKCCSDAFAHISLPSQQGHHTSSTCCS